MIGGLESIVFVIVCRRKFPKGDAEVEGLKVFFQSGRTKLKCRMASFYGCYDKRKIIGKKYLSICYRISEYIVECLQSYHFQTWGT